MEDGANYEIDDSCGKGADNKTDNAVKDGVFGFFDFAGIAGRSHVTDATNDDDYNGYDAEYANNCIKNGGNIGFKSVATTTNFVDLLAYSKFSNNIVHLINPLLYLVLFYNVSSKNAIVN